MPGETDLPKMLASLRIERREEPVTFVHLPEPVALGRGVLAVIEEDEGTTAVVTVREAERRGWSVGFRAAWLTVTVQSSLEAVGLTAALAAALAERGIPCNVLAGYFHDHLLVPVERADEAIEILEPAQAASGTWSIDRPDGGADQRQPHDEERDPEKGQDPERSDEREP